MTSPSNWTPVPQNPDADSPGTAMSSPAHEAASARRRTAENSDTVSTDAVAPAGSDAPTQYLPPVDPAPQVHYSTASHAERMQTEEFRARQAAEADRRVTPQSVPVPQDRPASQRPVEPAPVVPDAPDLFAHRFLRNKALTNVIIAAVLCGVITGAVVFGVDQLVTWLSDSTGEVGTPMAVIYGILAAVAVLAAGAVYVPTAGSGSEGLLQWAYIAVTVAAVIFWAIAGNLFDGAWEVLVALTGIIGIGISASVASSRMDKADIHNGDNAVEARQLAAHEAGVAALEEYTRRQERRAQQEKAQGMNYGGSQW